ncbi:MAG: DUF1501 domain-containing protein [Planctomycetota bacterium]
MCRKCKKTRKLNRRLLLKGAAAGAAGVAISPIIGRSPLFAGGVGGNNKFLIVINMLGGNDGLNMVIPGGDARGAYETRRPNIQLSALNPDTGELNRPTGSEGLPLLGLENGYDLHYSMTGLRQMWLNGELHVVNKVGYPQANLSHFTSQDIYSSGMREYGGPNGDGRGWLGRFSDLYCSNPAEPMGVVSVGLGRRRDFEGDLTEALITNASNATEENGGPLSTFRVDGEDFAYRRDHDLRIQTIAQALDIESTPPTEPATSIYTTEKSAAGLVERVKAGVDGWDDPETYNLGTSLGRYLRGVSQLLQGINDFRTKVFYTGMGGFDTHSIQLNRHESLMTQLDDAVSAFRADLVARNLWDRCAVVVISEFGRRNFENGSEGTDHGHGNCFMVVGGNVNGGLSGLYQESEIADVNQVVYDPTKAPNEAGGGYDFREIYADIIGSHLNLNPANVFPETYNNTGSLNLFV